MFKRLVVILFSLALILTLTGMSNSKGMQIFGVNFPEEKNIAGKVLKLNGAAGKKALGTVTLFARGFYLENPTHDAVEAIESEQVKYFAMHYLTNKITAGRLQKSFTRAMNKSNPPELVNTHQKNIDTFASWLDKKTYPGMTSSGTYEPGKGLTFISEGIVKGTIPGKEFAQMYFRTSLGDTSDKELRKGYLGL